MELEDPAEERRRFELVGAAIAFVVVATVVAFFVLVVLPAGRDDPPAAAAPSPTPTQTESPSPEPGPRLLRPVELRSGPASNVAIVTRLAETDAIRVVGRSDGSDWLAVGLVDRPGVSGWVPADAVSGVPSVAALPVLEGPGGEPVATPGGGTLTPDLPDLVVERAFARNNRLMVSVLNQGAGDAAGEFMVSINGGDPILLDVKPGEPLRPGQTLEAPIPDHYVQLRQAFDVLLVPTVDRPEEDEANNEWSGIVEPDAPNDVEVVGATNRPPEGTLVVLLRNNSPIPVIGSVTVSVREALPSTALLGRQTLSVEWPAGGLQEFEFPEVVGVTLSQVTVNASMNAIQDADITNNVFPR